MTHRFVSRLFYCVSVLALLALGVSIPIEASSTGEALRLPYWVYLNETSAAPTADATHDLSPRAVKRLSRVGHIAGSDSRDRAIDSADLAPLIEREIEIRQKSRWLHAVSALLTEEEAVDLLGDPRVRMIRRVGRYVRPIDKTEAYVQEPRITRPRKSAATPSQTDPATLSGIDYGEAWEQLEVLGIPELHDRGYGGNGVLVAVFDSGFFKEHSSLSSLDLVAERDFVQGDDNVQHDPADTSSAHPAAADRHGTYTWSALGGFAPGNHMGAAYQASFVLARTEDVTREVHLEEDNYIAALEWADSLGVDLVSSSLGYLDFDDGSGYSIDNLDGESIPISRAAKLASRRGIVVVTSMGNDGPDPSSLIAPADADSIISVGAVDFSGNLAYFSSLGPTGDGRIKPDVVAVGVQTHCAVPFGPDAYGRVNGTSLSAPLISGLSVLLIEVLNQLNTAWTPADLIAMLRESGDRADSPSNSYGWGIPDGLRSLGFEEDRLRIVRYDWTESGSDAPDGVIDWGEMGQLRLWIRNTGTSPSQEMSLVLGDHDDRFSADQGSAGALPSIAPGDSVLSDVLATALIDEGTESDWLGLFFRFEGGEIDFERRLYIILAPVTQVPVTAGAYPNPAQEGEVRLPWPEGRLEIYSVTGRLVRTMSLRSGFPDPSHVTWDLRDDGGRKVPAGFYLARDSRGRTTRVCVLPQR